MYSRTRDMPGVKYSPAACKRHQKLLPGQGLNKRYLLQYNMLLMRYSLITNILHNTAGVCIAFEVMEFKTVSV